MITLVTSIIMILATLYALSSALKNELFRYFIHETIFAKLIVSIGILAIIGGGFFILGSLVPTPELAVILSKFGAISIRIGVAILWFTNSYLISQRNYRLEALIITSILSASIITYFLSPMRVINVYGFWERGFYSKPSVMSAFYIDSIFVGILIIGTVLSQIYALMAIHERMDKYYSVVKGYFAGSALIILVGFVAWFIIRSFGALDYIYNGVVNIALALVVLLWIHTVGSMPQVLVFATTHISAFIICDKTRPDFRFEYNPDRIHEGIIETIKNTLDVQRIVLFDRMNIIIHDEDAVHAIFYTDNYNELLRALIKYTATKIKKASNLEEARRYVGLLLPGA